MPSTTERILWPVLVAVVAAACVGGPAVSSATQPAESPGVTAGAAASAPQSTIGSGSGQASPGATIVIVPAPTADQTAPGSTLPTAAPLGLVGLRYALVEELGRPIFCDPDFYPVARSNEAELAELRYPEIRADVETYRAISAHLGINAAAKPTVAQILAIYREWKMLRALVFEPGGSEYRFDYVAASAPGANEGWRVTGTIDNSGTITLEHRDPSGAPPCPICLARGTRISTPGGNVAAEDLEAGMVVWTATGTGALVAARVLLVGSTAVPPTHAVVHLVLADGRMLDASPGHPLADGRRLGDLHSDDLVDGSLVVTADLVPYMGGATYDLLPDGPTGTYWANGILLGSTLHRST